MEFRVIMSYYICAPSQEVARPFFGCQGGSETSVTKITIVRRCSLLKSMINYSNLIKSFFLNFFYRKIWETLHIL